MSDKPSASSSCTTLKTDAAVAAALANEQVFAVEPKKDCPHVPSSLGPFPSGGVHIDGSCQGCKDRTENWVCLNCFAMNCARAVKGCSVVHAATKEHPVVLSVSDLSVWCYTCDSYISHESLFPYKKDAYRKKFGEDPPNNVV